jgi:hypothetical protein
MALVCTQRPIQWVTGFFSGGKEAGGGGVNLITNFHLVRGLIMSGGMSLLPLYAFMTWPETTLPSFTMGKDHNTITTSSNLELLDVQRARCLALSAENSWSITLLDLDTYFLGLHVRFAG